jgi:SAM-dependent methyltransferase
MPAYERFARFYDAAMDDPGPRAARVLEFINRHRPGAATLLELGCGTGSILARLHAVPSLTGLDQSLEMLAVARQKVPGARLLEGELSTFSLGERFDVVVCVFDTLNHLLDFGAWQATFAAVADHLEDGGLFVLDVNTVGELRRLGDEQPWVYEFDDNVLIMDVSMTGHGLSSWDIRIFENVGESQYLLHQEAIGELAVELSVLRPALEERFDILEEVDDDGLPPTDDSIKAHFALRRRS